jgi:hypothetical protein
LGNEYPLNWVGWLDVDHSGTGRNVAWVALNTRSRTRAWFPRSVGYALSITTKSKNVVLLVSIVELATRFVNHVHGLSRNHINQRHSSLEQRTFEMILSSPVLRAGKNLQVCWSLFAHRVPRLPSANFVEISSHSNSISPLLEFPL